jgi:D-psicose/D-tagatose/L-ribulose 3-epimerase
MQPSNKLGVCTWTFGNLPLTEIAQRVHALGFDGVELMGDLEHYRPLQAAQVLRDHGLEIFSLTPDNVDLAHPDGCIRSAAIDYYLRLLDFAGELGNPLVSCHGCVGRVRAISSQADERALFASAVRQIAERAHLLITAAEAVEFVDELGADNLGILLDAYHMNIEEPEPGAALRHAGHRLWLYHTADSNRQGIGRGHTDFSAQIAALADIKYDGPMILECTAPGPDPFTAIKGEDSLTWLETYLQESGAWLRTAL